MSRYPFPDPRVTTRFVQTDEPECEDDSVELLIDGVEAGHIQLTGREFGPWVNVKGKEFAMRNGGIHRTWASAAIRARDLMVMECWL